MGKNITPQYAAVAVFYPVSIVVSISLVMLISLIPVVSQRLRNIKDISTRLRTRRTKVRRNKGMVEERARDIRSNNRSKVEEFVEEVICIFQHTPKEEEIRQLLQEQCQCLRCVNSRPTVGSLYWR